MKVPRYMYEQSLRSPVLYYVPTCLSLLPYFSRLKFFLENKICAYKYLSVYNNEASSTVAVAAASASAAVVVVVAFTS